MSAEDPVELAVPALALTDEAGVEPVPVKPVAAPGSGRETRRQTAEEKRRSGVRYFVEHGIPEKMNTLLAALLKKKPENPLAFCVAYLRTFENLAEIEDGDATPEQDEADRQYIAAHRIAFLFDELLNGMLTELPADPLAYTLTWLRWYRGKFEEE